MEQDKLNYSRKVFTRAGNPSLELRPQAARRILEGRQILRWGEYTGADVDVQGSTALWMTLALRKCGEEERTHKGSRTDNRGETDVQSEISAITARLEMEVNSLCQLVSQHKSTYMSMRKDTEDCSRRIQECTTKLVDKNLQAIP
ncbi:hypothetical protein J6590_017233 [Homalodisca vitripennis]|nr:hypothetical protein J6590_017233 [Homalodisca vitripennis]